MRVLILGADGMLGHRLLLDLANTNLELAGTVRKSDAEFYLGKFKIRDYNIFYNIDARDLDSIELVISEFKPDYIINCIGYIKQRGSNDIPLMIYLNSEFPHHLSKICETENIKLFLMSTDCVFSGDRGNYKETDIPDARDHYGISKRLGEISSPQVLTLRTSIIGHELFASDSLLEWFLKQDKAVRGFKRAIFSGFTTNEMANIIRHIIDKNIFHGGIYQVSSNPISKYDLLLKIKKVYGLRVQLIEDYEFKCDRSLESTRFRNQFGYEIKEWDNMITEMKLNEENR